MRLEEIVSIASEAHASDVHISPNDPLRFRIHGALKILNDTPLSAEECDELARAATGDGYDRLVAVGEYDMAATYAGVRCRLNIYRVDGGYAIALRLLAEGVPELMRLGLPPVVSDFATYQKGIVLVTGETGSGKSTTLAAIVNEINRTRPDHIITLEDPIEYVYESQKSLVNQREIGRDTESFAAGLRAILREDPDVILVGEMRDLDTIETALTAAETGHLVFGTLHTQSAADSVDRLVDVFPEARQRQIRMQLSMTLKAVVSQQLLPKATGDGRALACEIMIVNAAIRNLIREAKTPQIENTISTTASIGSITMDADLIRLVRARTISAATAIEAAHDRDYVSRQVR
ncbi:MAG: PilT/PilU family type 4a pilus ATPase [Olsenella sp.]|nr:PilT/PilU family type 4a pilus ATPase [Olsenella sp.]